MLPWGIPFSLNIQTAGIMKEGKNSPQIFFRSLTKSAVTLDVTIQSEHNRIPMNKAYMLTFIKSKSGDKVVHLMVGLSSRAVCRRINCPNAELIRLPQSCYPVIRQGCQNKKQRVWCFGAMLSFHMMYNKHKIFKQLRLSINEAHHQKNWIIYMQERMTHYSRPCH